MTNRADPQLERAFGLVREAEVAEAPSFAEVVSRRPAGVRGAASKRGLHVRPGWRGVGLTAAAVAAAVAAVALWQSARTDAFDAALMRAATESHVGSWRAPTDFLLDVRGRERFRYMPLIPSPLPLEFPELITQDEA